MNSQITIDLKKVIYCRYWWENQYGLRSKFKMGDSTNGIQFVSSAYAACHHDYPFETCYERALRLEILDIWKPVCLCVTVSSKRVTFTGDRATNIWEKWNAMMFNKKKK